MNYAHSMKVLYPTDTEWATLSCPFCGEECRRDRRNGVEGPFGCPSCRWSEDPNFDLRNDRDPVQYDGAVIDQWGGVFGPGTIFARLVVEARVSAREDGRPWPPKN